jgi:hypothetical protein
MRSVRCSTGSPTRREYHMIVSGKQGEVDGTDGLVFLIEKYLVNREVAL